MRVSAVDCPAVLVTLCHAGCASLTSFSPRTNVGAERGTRRHIRNRVVLLAGREQQRTALLVAGVHHEIARELSLSTNTNANHIASILAELDLENRIQAAVQAVRSGIS